MENSYKVVIYKCPKDNATVTYGKIGMGMTGKCLLLGNLISRFRQSKK